MTMKLSNKFNEIRQNFLNAVANGAPQEEQAKLYNEMIESMTWNKLVMLLMRKFQQ